MPKGKKKGKSMGGGKSRGEILGTSDEDSLNDNNSVISLNSDGTYLDDGGFEEPDEQAQSDVFEEKLMEAIDGLTQKSAQGRTSCLESVGTSLTMKYIPEFVLNRKMTLTDCIERCLKKGRGVEQAAAAQLATLLCVQLGSGDYTDEVFREISPLLTLILLDHSMSVVARSKCCWALGLLSFLANTGDVDETMSTLESIFSGSYRKGDGSIPTVAPEIASLHYAALSAWSLLLTITDLSSLSSLPTLNQLSGLLDSTHLDVRMAAGEGIALLLEQARQVSDDWLLEGDEDLLEKLRQLATDSHKYRAKKDRKTQRSSFRDILRFVENDEPPNIQVRFGQEALALDSWSRKKQYDAFCQVLGSGLNLHLRENDLLRDILELGEKISPLNMNAVKQTKLARHLMNAANFKARSISRAKNRDKRSAVVIM